MELGLSSPPAEAGAATARPPWLDKSTAIDSPLSDHGASLVCRKTVCEHVPSISRRAADSDSVVVRPHSDLIVIQSTAYWHQQASRGGRHSSGPLLPLDQLADALTAMRCPG